MNDRMQAESLNNRPPIGMAMASRRTTLNGKAVRRESPGGLNLEPSLVGEFSKLCKRAVLASEQDQLQRERGHAVLWQHATQDHDATARACCLGTTAQNELCFSVGPVVENRLQEIEICSGWQRVEETLPDRSGPFPHASRLQERLRAGHCRWEIDQGTLDLRVGTQDLGKQRSRPATDIYHRLHLLPISREEDLRVRLAV